MSLSEDVEVQEGFRYRDAEGDEWRGQWCSDPGDDEFGDLYLVCDRTGQVLSPEDVESCFGPMTLVDEVAGGAR